MQSVIAGGHVMVAFIQRIVVNLLIGNKTSVSRYFNTILLFGIH